MPDIGVGAARIRAAHRKVPAGRSVLAVVSGIDGSGKGWVAARLLDALRADGLRVAAINVDGWLNLPEKRFSRTNPPLRFYLHAIRFDEMFEQLVLPLRDHRSVLRKAEFVEETATAYREHTYAFDDIDIILLEGIYLLKREFRGHYDVSFWLDCSFETALERALARGQEGLPPEETVRSYRTVYFPAQEIHFARDAPQKAATTVLTNDPRLEPETPRLPPASEGA